MDGPILTFGPFRYDSGQRQLFRGEEAVALMPKAIDTLHALIERRGQIVEKAELMRLVWPDTTVEEIGLARNISILRKALGDESETYIETVPRRGYRFAAAGQTTKNDRLPHFKWLAVAVCILGMVGFVYWQFYLPSRYLPRGAQVSIAVIPFDTSGSADSALSQEFNEVLVAEISKLPAVQVISPSTVRRYQRLGISPAFMARILGLEVILEGAMRKAAGRVEITGRMADVHSGKLIWADTFETAGEPGQGVAQAIAAQVGGHLKAAKPK